MKQLGVEFLDEISLRGFAIVDTIDIELEIVFHFFSVSEVGRAHIHFQHPRNSLDFDIGLEYDVENAQDVDGIELLDDEMVEIVASHVIDLSPHRIFSIGLDRQKAIYSLLANAAIEGAIWAFSHEHEARHVYFVEAGVDGYFSFDVLAMKLIRHFLFFVNTPHVD